MTTLCVTIDASGASAPDYATIFASLQDSARGIFGSDIYINSDSQDGQMLGVFAKLIDDNNQQTLANYNGYSPVYAQGVSLSAQVKINGLNRDVASNSTSIGTVSGTPGVPIVAGVVRDDNGQLWNLPTPYTIPPGGEGSVTVTAQQVGDITAVAGSINAINNPQRGWSSFVSTVDAVPGAPVEPDAILRQRQQVSTALPAQTIVEGISAAVANVTGVTRSKVYENDTAAADVNGVPAHSISVVVAGGDALAVATAIAIKKTPGGQTYGSTSEVVVDKRGIPATINLFELVIDQVYVSISLTALTGYVSATGTLLQAVVAAWLDALDIGEDVSYFDLGAPIKLSGDVAVATANLTVPGITQAQLDVLAATYKVTGVTIGLAPTPVGVIDIPIAFNAAAGGTAANVALTVS